jgi:hypothetical protein
MILRKHQYINIAMVLGFEWASIFHGYSREEILQVIFP